MKIQKEDENTNQNKNKKQNDEINGNYQNDDVYNKSNIVKGKILKSDETLKRFSFRGNFEEEVCFKQ